MPSPTARILSSAIVLCWTIAATVPAACLGSGRSRKEVISYLYPSFDYFTSRYNGELKYSWDAGAIDGALHLTGDDIYQPPVQYLPDAKRPAGRVTIWAGPSYIDPRTEEELLSHEASFNTSFTMSVNRSQQRNDDDGGLLLEVLPTVLDQFDRTIYYSLFRTTTSSNISVDIGKLEYYYQQGTRGVYVSVSPASTAKHTVWVDYDAVGHNLSVYIVDGGGKPKPGHATLHALLDIDGILGRGSFYKNFGLFASKNRLVPSCQPVIYSWNVTADSWTVTADSPSVGGRRRRRIGGWLLAIVVSSSVLVAAGAAIILVAWRWSLLVSWYRALVMKLKLSRALRRLPGTPREFKFADVKKATKNFQESNRLGRGGFGAVYKGTILIAASSDGGRQLEGRRRRRYVEVAVKKFTRKEDRGYDDFLAEVAIINRLRHRNIVPLLGWCYEKGQLLLIYQYMPNGSLDQHLFHRNRQRTVVLPWETRYRVVADVAAALHYVHHEYERVVLHRDIKASNIMLDANFNGRLGDFGLAGLVDDADKNSLTDHAVAGTWGFIAPEYPVTHKATRQTDVYAFGALVLEIVTGKRSLGTAGADEFLLLTDWVWRLHGEGRLLEAVDDELLTAAAREVDLPDVSTRLLESVDLRSELDTSTSFKLDATRLLLLGLACTNPNPTDRPSTADLVQIIAKRIAPPDVPLVKPTFLELPLLDDLDLDEDDDDPDYSNTGTLSREGLALSIGSLSLEIMVCRSRRSLP